jgi:chromate reductase, NAD(P)H dehydrogenase (quinone)
MPNILIFSGSLREQSYNRRLIRYMAKMLGGRCHVDMLETSECSFPVYNEDLENSRELVEQVGTVYERFMRADGIIIASPEYNGHVSSYLKNTIDWLSRMQAIHERYQGKNAFYCKPVLLTAASTGAQGGLRGIQSAKPLFDYLGCFVFPGEICVGFAEQRFPEEHDNIDPPLAQYLARKTDAFLSAVRKMKGEEREPAQSQ